MTGGGDAEESEPDVAQLATEEPHNARVTEFSLGSGPGSLLINRLVPLEGCHDSHLTQSNPAPPAPTHSERAKQEQSNKC